MPVYKDSSGQLVIATSMPVGGSAVTAASSGSLVDIAPWYRVLDANNTDWHPAKYYGGAAESAALGTNGYSNAQVPAYKRSATLPTDNPGNVTYDFTNASITTSLGAGWYSDIPTGSGPVYVVFAPAASQDTTINILTADWTNPPVLLFDSGTDGESSFPSFVFIRSATQPATPTGGSYASPLPTTVGWSDGIPSDNNQPLWMSKRVFSKSGGAPQDAAWSATSKVGTPSTSSKLQFSVDGTTGWHDTPSAGDEFMRSGTSTDNGATWSYAGVVRIKGEAGSSGTATRGPAHWYTSGSFWSDSVANTVVTAAGYTPMAGDQVTISGTNFAHVKKWNGSSWIDLGQVITGDLVVENSITVNKLNTNSIEVRDNFGNVLFSVNVPLDYDRIGGTNRPANGADVTHDNLAGRGINICNARYSSFEESTQPPIHVINGTALQVGFNRFFGSNSLALTATINDCYAYLGASGTDYNIKISPNKKWILSMYCLSSSAANVEILIRTSASGAHYGGASVVLPPSTWYRVSIVVDLTADNSTGAIFRIDNNINGHVVFYDGLMMEEQVGTQTTPSAYSSPAPVGAMSNIDQITPENSDVYIGTAAIKGAHIGYAEIDTLRVAGGAVTSVDTDVLQGALSIPNPADADGLYGSKVVILQQQLPIVDMATDRVIDINFILYHGCPNPGRLWVSIEKNGTEYASVSFNPLTRFVMGASIQPYSFTFEIPVGANENAMARVKLQTMNGSGTTERWSGTPPAILSGARLVCHTGKR